jgi:hypothetical protein
MGQTPTSKSAMVNSAAKDDYLQWDGDNKYALSLILANDPGSAVFKSFSTGDVVLDGNGNFVIGAATLATGYFDYTVRMANGTYSTARVYIQHHFDDVELVSNWSFEDPTVSPPFGQFSSINGWVTQAGSAQLEVVNSPYSNGAISSVYGDQWLDTQGTPGGIDIGQLVDVATGNHAELDITLAIEDLLDGDPTHHTDPNEVLEILWNGSVVGSIHYADFALAGVGANTMHTFAVMVVGQAGADSLEIRSVGAPGGQLVGYALDAVSLHQWAF